MQNQRDRETKFIYFINESPEITNNNTKIKFITALNVSHTIT